VLLLGARAAPGQVVKVSCGSAIGGSWFWAWPFVGGTVGLLSLYCVGGVYLNSNAGKTGKEVLPHLTMWQRFFGLVNDVREQRMHACKPACVHHIACTGHAGAVGARGRAVMCWCLGPCGGRSVCVCGLCVLIWLHC
jgi:hypothetical protein